MTLLLMAAGSGSRYGKLKQFDDLGPAGEFLMEFSIYDAIKFGFNHIVIITKEANKSFLEEYLSKRLAKNIKLDVLVQSINDLPKNADIDTSERQKPWGTAHAVWTARHVINSDFVIINADDYYGENSFRSIADFVKNNNTNNFALVGYNLNETLSEYGSVSRGVCKAKDGKLISIEEHTKIEKVNDRIVDQDSDRVLEPSTLVSMNFWMCNPSIFNYIETYFTTFLEDKNNLEKSEIYLPFVAQEMMSKNIIDVNVIEANSKWFGVTYYDDKQEAVKTLKDFTNKGLYPSPLWE